MLQMIAEAILSPVHLPASTVGTLESSVAAAADAGKPALLWELEHLAQSVAAGKAEEAAIRQASHSTCGWNMDPACAYGIPAVTVLKCLRASAHG